jgi:hypothetical protein
LTCPADFAMLDFIVTPVRREDDHIPERSKPLLTAFS